MTLPSWDDSYDPPRSIPLFPVSSLLGMTAMSIPGPLPRDPFASASTRPSSLVPLSSYRVNRGDVCSPCPRPGAPVFPSRVRLSLTPSRVPLSPTRVHSYRSVLPLLVHTSRKAIFPTGHLFPTLLDGPTPCVLLKQAPRRRVKSASSENGAETGAQNIVPTTVFLGIFQLLSEQIRGFC